MRWLHHPSLKRLFHDAVWEFFAFGCKQLRACCFAGLFFLAVFLVPRDGVGGIARYDALFGIALLIQIGLLMSRLETWDELRAISLFHGLGFLLEWFKTSQSIQSWAYPEPALTKLWGVPLFSGFMYAAVGSYIIQAWRLQNMRISHHPRYWMAWCVALALYANFFTHHFMGDYRWYLAALALGLYARTQIHFTAWHQERQMPLILGLILVGFFIWLAENLGTFMGLWAYPHQMGAWAKVHMSKWSSWTLLVLLSFTMVANLKHIKQTVSVPA